MSRGIASVFRTRYDVVEVRVLGWRTSHDDRNTGCRNFEPKTIGSGM
ncbi:MAG: hypothetical protein WB919_02030 [Candidatus Sulfotelmatobacter sp.]